jgi:predicted alpha/beta-fold hydrolase
MFEFWHVTSDTYTMLKAHEACLGIAVCAAINTARSLSDYDQYVLRKLLGLDTSIADYGHTSYISMIQLIGAPHKKFRKKR